VEIFLCPFCKYEAGTVSKDGLDLVFCVSCNIYWGENMAHISDTIKSPLLKHIFDPKVKYPEPIHTRSDKFWYAFSALLILIAALLI